MIKDLLMSYTSLIHRLHFPLQVLMVRFASLFDVAARTVTFLNGKRYSLETLQSLGAGELLSAMCDFSEKLATMQLDADEMSLFTAVVLVSAGTDTSSFQKVLLESSDSEHLITKGRQNAGDGYTWEA